jgi:hypothetical protein
MLLVMQMLLTALFAIQTLIPFDTFSCLFLLLNLTQDYSFQISNRLVNFKQIVKFLQC